MSTIATAKTLRKSLRFCIGASSHLLMHSGAISCASNRASRPDNARRSARAVQPQRGHEQRARQQARNGSKQTSGHVCTASQPTCRAPTPPIHSRSKRDPCHPNRARGPSDTPPLSNANANANVALKAPSLSSRRHVDAIERPPRVRRSLCKVPYTTISFREGARDPASHLAPRRDCARCATAA
jgi:hypothetical protein